MSKTIRSGKRLKKFFSFCLMAIFLLAGAAIDAQAANATLGVSLSGVESADFAIKNVVHYNKNSSKVQSLLNQITLTVSANGQTIYQGSASSIPDYAGGWQTVAKGQVLVMNVTATLNANADSSLSTVPYISTLCFDAKSDQGKVYMKLNQASVFNFNCRLNPGESFSYEIRVTISENGACDTTGATTTVSTGPGPGEQQTTAPLPSDTTTGGGVDATTTLPDSVPQPTTGPDNPTQTPVDKTETPIGPVGPIAPTTVTTEPITTLPTEAETTTIPYVDTTAPTGGGYDDEPTVVPTIKTADLSDAFSSGTGPIIIGAILVIALSAVIFLPLFIKRKAKF